MLYLVVSQGPDPERAVPILACSDQKILRRVAHEISEVLGGGQTKPARRDSSEPREVRGKL